MNEGDRIRLEQLGQFRKEIRGSKEYLAGGIDVAKDKHHAFFGAATGKTLFRRLVFENNLEGVGKLLAQAEAMKVQEGLKKVVFGMEPTGNYPKPLREHLMGCGRQVVLVSGVAAHENRKTLDGRWDTNDTRDAANVADLVSQGECLFNEFPVGALQDFRNLLWLKRRLKKQEHGIGCGFGIICWPSIFRRWTGTMGNRRPRLWGSSVGVWTPRRSRSRYEKYIQPSIPN